MAKSVRNHFGCWVSQTVLRLQRTAAGVEGKIGDTGLVADDAQIVPDVLTQRLPARVDEELGSLRLCRTIGSNVPVWLKNALVYNNTNTTTATVKESG